MDRSVLAGAAESLGTAREVRDSGQREEDPPRAGQEMRAEEECPDEGPCRGKDVEQDQ